VKEPSQNRRASAEKAGKQAAASRKQTDPRNEKDRPFI